MTSAEVPKADDDQLSDAAIDRAVAVLLRAELPDEPKVAS